MEVKLPGTCQKIRADGMLVRAEASVYRLSTGIFPPSAIKCARKCLPMTGAYDARGRMTLFRWLNHQTGATR